MAYTEPVAPAPVGIYINPPIRTILAPNMAALQAALVNPQFGDEIVLTPGVNYVGALTLPVPGGQVGGGTISPAVVQVPMTLTYPGTPIGLQRQIPPTLFVSTSIVAGENFVTIRTSGTLPAGGARVHPTDVAQMPNLQASAGGEYCIAGRSPGYHHYRLVGLHFTTPKFSEGAIVNLGAPPLSDQTQLATYPHHMSVEQCYFAADEDLGVNKTLALQGRHMQVKGCFFTNCYQPGNGDANAIWIDLGPGPYLVEDCCAEGMGEIIFVGGSLGSGIPITPGYDYVHPQDVTIRRSHLRRRWSWKSDEPTYKPFANVVGVGTFTTTGTTIKFSVSQTANNLVGRFIKRVTTNESRRIVSGSNLTYVMASVFAGGDVSTSESFRYNDTEMNGKNLYELKGAQRVRVEECLFERGWVDGQTCSFVLTPRELGEVTDHHMRWCKWSYTSGHAWSNGDVAVGYAMGASPRATKNYKMEHCLWEHTSAVRVNIGNNNPQAVFMNVAQTPWGFFWGPGANALGNPGTIKAGALGPAVNITFTATQQVFSPEQIGLTLAYGAGRATVLSTAVNRLSCVATITIAFPDTATHNQWLWQLGPPAMLGTSLTPDSIAIEHCTWAGTDLAYTYPLYLSSNLPVDYPTGGYTQPPTATNFIYRNNVLHAGVNPGNGNGIFGEGNLYGKNAADFFCASATRDFRKNVIYGTNLLTGFNFSQYYTGDLEAGAGSGHIIGMHEPDQTGSGLGGSVGFTNYAAGDYRLTAGSQYHNWGTDGTDPGCDIATLNTKLVGVASPDFDIVIVPPPPPPVRAMAMVIAGEPNLPLNGTTTQVTVTSTGNIFPTTVTLRRDTFPTFGTMTPDPQVIGRFTFTLNINSGAWGGVTGPHTFYADGTYPDAVVLTVSDTVNVADPTPPPPPPGTYPAAVVYSGTIAVPGLTRPGYRASVIDPIFGTQITRISDESMGSVSDPTLMGHEYAKVQAWNSDMTLIKLLGANFIIDATTYAVVGGSRGFHNESKWAHTDPNTIYYTTNNGQFHKWNVSTGSDVNLRTFGSGVLYMGPYEGNISKDDRWVCLTLGDTVYIYDILNNNIESTFSLTAKGGTTSPDWVSISPSGLYVVICWRGGGGFEDPRAVSYNRVGMGRVATLYAVGEHLDMGYTVAGIEAIASTCGFSFAQLSNGSQTNLPSGACGHVSGRNTARPGYAYYSDQDDSSGTRGELIAFKLDGSGLCERWCHTRTNRVDYNASAKGSSSPDGTRVIFNSEWTPGGTVYCYVGVRP